MRRRNLIFTGLTLAIAAGYLPQLPGSSGTVAPVATCMADASPQEKLLTKRAAQLDAYRQIAERIFGFEINSSTTVRGYVTQNDRAAAAFDHFIKGIRLGEARYFDDGSCEVDAEVTIEQVVEALTRISDEVKNSGSTVSKNDIQELSKKTVQKAVQVTGFGATRPKADVPDPQTVVVVHSVKSAIPLPEIYKKYPSNARLMAKRAAELDAYRHLFERVYGLQLSSNTTVRDFVTENDRIRASFEGRLRGARIMNTTFRDDGVVEVQMEMTIEKVVECLKLTYDEVKTDGKFTRDSFTEVTRKTTRKVIAVTGEGALDTGKANGTEGTSGDRDIETIIVP